MDSFYLIVLGVATFVLILMLAFLGWTMSQTKKGENYPAIVKTCPDNWKVDSTAVSGKILCKRPASGQTNYGNVDLTTYMGLSTSAGYVDSSRTNFINFADAKWSSVDPSVPNPNCAKRKWAIKHNIKWDSIDSANYCD